MDCLTALGSVLSAAFTASAKFRLAYAHHGTAEGHLLQESHCNPYRTPGVSGGLALSDIHISQLEAPYITLKIDAPTCNTCCSDGHYL